MTETAERLNNQAILLAKDGSYTEAIACFARAIMIDKTNALLWFNLALTYRDAGNLTHAKAILMKAKELAPEDTDIIKELALLMFSLGDFDSSLNICAEGLCLNPEDYNLWNTRGVNFFNKGIYDEACESFENAVYLNPYYADALFNLRDTYVKIGNKIGENECSMRLRELNHHGEKK